MSHRPHSATAAFVLSVTASAAVAGDAIDFNRDIRPILSDKCYACHGPDAENRAAELRLDVREEAIDYLEYGFVEERIYDDDPDFVMPPPESNLSLSANEKRLLTEWIKAGAIYDTHWAFVPPPAEVTSPEKADDDWSRTELDRFVLERIRTAGHEPAAPAAPERWLRRVTFDLTGLPPTADEVTAFTESLTQANGDREPIYKAAVDRLLAAPAYGEHMAIAWLDAARYADSYGYQSDQLNTQWPYRDWVVRSFNDNLPYDEFLTWQLAGDLLDEPTREQRLATAFNRLHRLNNEGGAVFEEWRIENVADRVQTFGTAVLGLTLECCRCHDHKYDPIPTKDFYSLAAFFNSIDESGVYDRTIKVPAPSLLLPSEEQEAALRDARREVAAAEAAYERAVAAARTTAVDETPVPDLEIALAFDGAWNNDLKTTYIHAKDDNRFAPPLDRVPVHDSSIPRLPATIAADAAADSPRRAVRFDGERGISLRGIEPFDRWTPFSVALSLKDTAHADGREVVAHFTRGTDCGFNGWDLIAEDGYLESRMYRVWPGNAIGVRTVDPLPVDRWIHVVATYDGSSRAGGLRLFLDGHELPTTVLRDGTLKKQAAVLNKVAGKHGGKFNLGQRFRDRGFADGLIDDLRIYRRALTPPEVKSLAYGTSVEPTAEYVASALDQNARAAMERLTEARRNLVLAEEVVHEIPVMEEMPEPRETHVLMRGEYSAPRSEETRVTRATLSEIGPAYPADTPRDRLGLARWVTDPAHPLTARVLVNRMWANFFGYGLVRTPENFGLQGELPTHPDMLDFLARDFIDHGWDVKRLCRQIVLSATYRQDSRATEDLLIADPENRLLARGPAYRLGAEQIRDLALAVAGRLDGRLGGAPVSPYQPGKDLWTESNTMSQSYRQSVGEALYRRSLYSVWKRTAPLPNMVAFDAQSREVCTVDRPRTNTPLQALVLLNDVQFVEASRLLATRSIEQRADIEERIAWAFLTLTGRDPDGFETSALRSLYEDGLSAYRTEPGPGIDLVSIGDSPVDTDIEPAELAALTVVCQTILNLDATVWKR